jgi:putative addiction module killer protein
MFEIWHYLTSTGRNIFEEWFDALTDATAQAKIATRIARMSAGNFGDCKSLRDGVWELRIDWGPGYRVYYALADRTVVLLLCGGDKRKQSADIERAVKFWRDYQERKKEQ